MSSARRSRSAALTRERESKRSWLDVFSIPKPAWAAVAALVVLAAFLPLLRQSNSPMQVVDLVTLRVDRPQPLRPVRLSNYGWKRRASIRAIRFRSRLWMVPVRRSGAAWRPRGTAMAGSARQAAVGRPLLGPGV